MHANSAPLSANDVAALKARVKTESTAAVARQLGVGHATLTRAISGAPLRAATATKLRTSPRKRSADEFDRGAAAVQAPRRFPGATAFASRDDALAWIRSARDAQIAGRFAEPVRLARAMRTDDALYTAYHARVSPQRVVASRLVPQASSRGESVAAKAREHCVASRDVLQGIAGTRANHGLAIGRVVWEPNDAGTVVGFRLTEWPLEFVRENSSTGAIETQTLEHGIVPITHGDGHWIVFKKFDERPWLHEAAVLPGSFVYAAHADGIADWAGASRAHGLAKVMGTLPQGVAMRESDGVTLTAEAAAYLNMLADLVSGEASAGMHAFGGDAEFLANGSTAWQIFSELILNRERAAARIYVGTDAYLGSVGDAPGVDIAVLFGVASTKLQGDLDSDSSALTTGLYQPWTAVNYGDSTYAPRHEYLAPDPDKAKRDAQNADAHDRLMTAIEQRRANRLVVDQEVVNELAARFGVEPAPTVAEANETTSTVNLAPTDIAKVVRVSEARASQGLPAFGDERDDMTLTELDERNKAKAQVATLSLDYNPNQPRAKDGKFGSGGGSEDVIDDKSAASAANDLANTKIGDTTVKDLNNDWNWLTASDRDSYTKPKWADANVEMSDRQAMRELGKRHGFEVKAPNAKQRRDIDNVTEWANDRGGFGEDTLSNERAAFIDSWEQTGWLARNGCVPAQGLCSDQAKRIA